MFGIGVTELGIILVVALLVFGPKRLPELARTLGRGMGEFRRASNELRQSLALDDLQNDLRRDLSGQGTIHKPKPPVDSQASSATAKTDTAGAASPQSTTGSTADPAGDPAPHPGELPLGNDHEHHDRPGNDLPDNDLPDNDLPGNDLPGDELEAGASKRSASTDPPRAATPAHPGLGNVPVSAEDPADPERG